MVSHVADDSAKPKPPRKGKDTDPAEPTSSELQKPDSSKPSPDTKPTRRRKPAPSKKARATSIQADLDKLEARLKRTDKDTRKSVASLENVVSALEASLKSANASQKGRLTRHINELTERLERQSKDMRMAVRRELKSALAEGSLADLDSALGRASLRLDRAEVAQADAIARVNKHLADIARAVDARINDESRARKKAISAATGTLTEAIAQTKSDVDRRVSNVERDSAAAFEKVGDTIEKIHGQLEDRRRADSKQISEKVNELALEAKAEMKSYQAKIDARFEEVETRNLAVGTGAAERVVERVREDIRHKIDALQDRIEGLEQKAAEPAPTAQVVPLPPLPASDNEPTDSASSAPPGDGGLSTNPVQVMQERLTAFGSTVGANAAGPDLTNPYAAALQPQQDASVNLDTTVAPSEPFRPQPPVFEAPPSPVVPFPGSSQPQNMSAPSLPPFQMPSATTPPMTEQDYQSTPMPETVYANPAYAEGLDSPSGLMGRIGSDSPAAVRVAETAKARRFTLPSLENGSLRLTLMAGVTILVAVFAARIILGSSDGDLPAVDNTAAPVVVNEPDLPTTPLSGLDGQQNPVIETVQPVIEAPDTSTDPIGQYEENQPVVIDTAELDTLDAAVEAGNPIAQYQLGLAQLDAGETESGAALIRQAANANQPAALYRLAKLYEAGEGVPRDDVMSRQLIERAARGGNRIAMHDLALYFTEGRGGVDLDMSAAKSWFEQAARRGVVDSQFNLAILSESAETGADPNLEDALFWYSIAARQGDQFAMSRRDALRASLDADRLEVVDARIADFTPRPIDEEANGIFKNVPWVKSAQLDQRGQVRQVQTLLASLGYTVGTPDGVMGNRTRSAIRQFEQSNGLNVTGEVNRSLIQRLNNASRA